jgi:hypothetical protein
MASPRQDENAFSTRSTLIISSCHTVRYAENNIVHQKTEITMHFRVCLSQVGIAANLHKRIHIPCTCPGGHNSEIELKAHAATADITFLSSFPMRSSHDFDRQAILGTELTDTPDTPRPAPRSSLTSRRVLFQE